MIVGIVQVEIFLYEVNSLKEKRHIVKSLIERLKSRFNISIAETSDLDIWNKGVIGFSVVGNSSYFVDSNISRVLNFIDNDGRLEIINQSIEII